MNAFPKNSIQSFKGSPVTLIHDLFVRCCCEVQYNIKHVSSAKKSRYLCRLCVSGGWKATAKGANKKQAKAAAAQQLLEIILGQQGEKNELSGSVGVNLPEGCEPPEKVLDALHRICEGRRLPPPHFITCESLMSQSPFIYKIECRILDKGLLGFGRNKKQAKRHAAMRMLLCLLLESWLSPSSPADQNSPRSDDDAATNEYLDSETSNDASEDEKNLLMSAVSKDEGGDRLLIRNDHIQKSQSSGRRARQNEVPCYHKMDYNKVGFDYSILQPVDNELEIPIPKERPPRMRMPSATQLESFNDFSDVLKCSIKIPQRSSFKEFEDPNRFHENHLPCLVRESSLEKSCVLESSGDAGCFWAALDDEFQKYLWWSQNNRTSQQEFGINNVQNQTVQDQAYHHDLQYCWNSSKSKSESSTDISTICIENEIDCLTMEKEVEPCKEAEIQSKEEIISEPLLEKPFKEAELFEFIAEEDFAAEHILNDLFYEIFNFRQWCPFGWGKLNWTEEKDEKELDEMTPVDYRRLTVLWKRFYSVIFEESTVEDIGELPPELFPVADTPIPVASLWKKFKLHLEPAEKWINKLAIIHRVLQVTAVGLFLIFLVYYFFTDEVSNSMLLLTIFETLLIINTTND